MATSTPTVSLVSELRFSDSDGTYPSTVVAGLNEVTSFDPHTRTLDPGASDTVTPAESPANVLVIQTPKKIRVRLNGGTEDIYVNRALVLFGDSITEVELFNDQLTPGKQQNVKVTFATGGSYT